MDADKLLIDTLREARRFNNVDDAPGQEGLHREGTA